jgi:hypothetical protein
MTDDQTQQQTDDQTDAGNTQQQAQGDGSTGNSDTANDERKYTQAEIDRMITERQKRDRKKWEAEAEEKARLAAMTEAERTAKEKADLEIKLKEVSDARANDAVIARAEVALAARGVTGEARIARAVKMLDLSNALTADGTVDRAAIARSIDETLEEFPGLISGQPPAKGGEDFGGGNGGDEKPADMDAYADKWKAKKKPKDSF